MKNLSTHSQLVYLLSMYSRISVLNFLQYGCTLNRLFFNCVILQTIDLQLPRTTVR